MTGVRLSQRQKAIVSYLRNGNGRIRSRDEILRVCWPEGTESYPESVDGAIKRLRAKFPELGRCIKAKYRLGYYWGDDDYEQMAKRLVHSTITDNWVDTLVLDHTVFR